MATNDWQVLSVDLDGLALPSVKSAPADLAAPVKPETVLDQQPYTAKMVFC